MGRDESDQRIGRKRRAVFANTTVNVVAGLEGGRARCGQWELPRQAERGVGLRYLFPDEYGQVQQ